MSMKTLYTVILALFVFQCFGQAQDVNKVVNNNIPRYDSLKNFLGARVRAYIGQTLYLNKKPSYRQAEGYEGFVIDYNEYKYSKSNIYECCGASYSKYEAMAGKRFRVLDVIRHPQAAGRPLRYGNIYYLHLQDIEKNATMYYEYNAAMETQFPFLVEGFMAKTKRRMIGADIVLKNSTLTNKRDLNTKKQVYCTPGTVWTCLDVMIDNDYHFSLVLTNNKNQKIAVDFVGMQHTKGHKYFTPEQAAANRKKFGDQYWNSVLMSQVRNGMTDEMCKLAWGEPQRINYVSDNGAHGQQWVYDDQYLYFRNGVLSSMHY